MAAQETSEPTTPERPASAPSELVIRRAEAEEFAAVVDVCGEALEWQAEDPNAAFFRWKHEENAFGPSPIWIATDPDLPGPGIVGVRVMMRWKFVHPDGSVRLMVRAVDTATLPSHQGKGIFTRLTRAAIEKLESEGVDAVFNTPNDKSRPGYVKMGWEALGRVPVSMRPRSLPALASILRSKTAAEKWGIPTDVGLDPSDAFGDGERLEATLNAAAPPTGWATPISVEYLRWRAGFPALECRVQPLGADLDRGFIVFRLRQRGEARQLSILHVVRRPGERSLGRELGTLLERTGADVAMTSGDGPLAGGRMIPVPRTGPIVTWRVLANADVPELSDLQLPLGTIELF